MKTIKELVELTHKNAVDKGFWEDWINCHDGSIGTPEYRNQMINNAISTRLMLIVSEVSEALEALRNNDGDNLAEELADIVIRTCDLAGGLSIDLEKEILRKIEINLKRSYKHGKEF